jgi:Domain of unknown function (DUF4328)
MTDVSSSSVPVDSAASSVAGFRDPTALTNFLKALLWITILLDAVGVLSTFLEITLLQNLQPGLAAPDAITKADAEANDMRQRIIGILQLALIVITATIFLRWIYRANKNARALGAAGMQFTPGWAVGWYFIPFMNLWVPYQAVKEIWKVSANPADWLNAPRGAILPWWWFCFIVSGIAGDVAYQIQLLSNDVSTYIASDVFSLVSEVLDIAGAYLAIVLVAEIVRMQRSHVRP